MLSNYLNLRSHQHNSAIMRSHSIRCVEIPTEANVSIQLVSPASGEYLRRKNQSFSHFQRSGGRSSSTEMRLPDCEEGDEVLQTDKEQPHGLSKKLWGFHSVSFPSEWEVCW
ncbi:hypothetical protein [Lyngbya aestuarii]|uniref:hypothetical protein n=1 Tax=Lyngbya aestuarii TaxID=118322 RepID=UPI00403D7AB7